MKKKLTILYIFFSLISIISIFLFTTFAQDITITVSADQEEENPTSIVFDEQDFKESQKTTVIEFLQSQSFLYIASGIDEAEIGYLILRGFSTSRIAIFLDGVPISLSQINALKLPLNLISKIVIYKGNVSALFGPNAIGGAILIWTKTIQEGTINFGTFSFSSLANFGNFLHFSSFKNNIFSSFDIFFKYNLNIRDGNFGKSNFYNIFSRYYFEYLNISFSFFIDYSKKYLPNDIQFPYFDTFKKTLSLISFLKYNSILVSLQYILDKFYCHDYIYNIDEEREIFYIYSNYPINIVQNKYFILKVDFKILLNFLSNLL